MNILITILSLLLFLSIGEANSKTAESESKAKPTFVLVHGTSNWGGHWNSLSKILEDAGYEVHSPSLTGLGEREHLLSRQIGLSTHIEDIQNYIEWLDLDNIILVGHSYGGAVITGVADKLANKLNHIVYMDATVLTNEENVLDQFPPSIRRNIQEGVNKLGDGWFISPEYYGEPRQERWRSHPFKTYKDKIELTHAPFSPGTLILATGEAQLFKLMRTKAKARANEYGWSVYTVDGPHPLNYSSPSREEVATILLNIAKSKK